MGLKNWIRRRKSRGQSSAPLIDDPTDDIYVIAKTHSTSSQPFAQLFPNGQFRTTHPHDTTTEDTDSTNTNSSYLVLSQRPSDEESKYNPIGLTHIPSTQPSTDAQKIHCMKRLTNIIHEEKVSQLPHLIVPCDPTYNSTSNSTVVTTPTVSSIEDDRVKTSRARDLAPSLTRNKMSPQYRNDDVLSSFFTCLGLGEYYDETLRTDLCLCDRTRLWGHEDLPQDAASNNDIYQRYMDMKRRKRRKSRRGSKRQIRDEDNDENNDENTYLGKVFSIACRNRCNTPTAVDDSALEFGEALQNNVNDSVFHSKEDVEDSIFEIDYDRLHTVTSGVSDGNSDYNSDEDSLNLILGHMPS